jgi:hypothetical protein
MRCTERRMGWGMRCTERRRGWGMRWKSRRKKHYFYAYNQTINEN